MPKDFRKQSVKDATGHTVNGPTGDSKRIVRRRPLPGGKLKADKYGRPLPDSESGK